MPFQSSPTFHHVYINNCFGAMIRGFADYFGRTIFHRSKDVVISTYEKALEHYRSRKNEAGEKISPRFPFVCMDVDMSFEPDPQMGRFFQGYPNFLGMREVNLWSPYIYKDKNMTIGAILNRYKGRFDIIVWCSSIYELIDCRFLAFQMFGGLERYIYPKNIEGYIVLPDEVTSYVYENEYTGERYSIDWENNESEVELIKNINQNKMVFPFAVKPYLRLSDVSDGADKYGGSGDELSDHRLVISIEWESYIPTHIGILTSHTPDPSSKPDMADIKFNLDLDIGYYYSTYSFDSSTGQKITNPASPPKDVINIVGDTSGSVKTSELTYKDKYSYILSAQDDFNIHSDPPVPFLVYLPEAWNDPYTLRIYGKYGEFKRDYQWRIVEPGVVEFLSFNLDQLREGDIIWFAFYHPMLNIQVE